MPTQKEKIEKWSLGYHILKFYVDRCTKVYFKTTLINKEKVPFDEVLIWGGNHQNALVDALVLLAIRTWQPVFLARADIFKKPTTAKILTFFKILPVYRIRDGYSNLQNNDEIFQKTMDVLRNKNGLVLMPEGNHGDKRNLRPLKKGIARIAFQAESASDNTLKIKIIPFGLEYEDYIKFRSKLLIRFGEPIDVSKYLALYKENEAKAYNALLEEFTEKIKPHMIHIEDDENYANIEMLRKIFTLPYIKNNKLNTNLNTKFEIDKKLIAYTDNLRANDPPRFNDLMGMVKIFASTLKEKRITPKRFPYHINPASFIFKIIALLVTIPLAVYGFINNFFVVIPPFKMSKNFKDPQFHSSVKLAVGLVLLPISYLLQTVIIWIVFGKAIIALAYFTSLPVSGIILYNWRRYWFSLVEDFFLLKSKKELLDFRLQHSKIVESIRL